MNGTIDLKLTIGGDSITNMSSWVDVSYGVHADCKSHTGGCISFGYGVLLTKCQKQKLNVKSSTEGEIVGVSDFLPNMIWARMFLGEQGFNLAMNVLFQDNQSAMKIEQNGKKSSRQKTKHMDNRYFWIKDRLESEGIEVKYCPTGIMVADFFTKPTQGKLFRQFRDVVLGYSHIDSLKVEQKESTSQERVRTDKFQKTDYASAMINTTKSKRNQPIKTVSWADIVRGSGQIESGQIESGPGLRKRPRRQTGMRKRSRRQVPTRSTASVVPVRRHSQPAKTQYSC